MFVFYMGLNTYALRHSPHTQAFSPQCLSLTVLTQGRPGKTCHIQRHTWMLGGHVEEWKNTSEYATDRKHRPQNDCEFDIRQSW